LVRKSNGIVVILARPTLWGVAARKFNKALRRTNVFQSGDLHWLDVDEFLKGHREGEYLALNDVYFPSMSFLGEESVASIEVVGKTAPGKASRAEVVFKVGESVIGSRALDVVADEQGQVLQDFEVPVSFVKPGTQVLTAQLNSELVREPLGYASTTVNVVHAKTTLLHIALGPDWSLRTLRSKLKFWPNVDLVSYFILRDIFSENSVPSNQLSLIEFPSAKLFGEQLPNFHGVVIQNFPFGNYLNPEESKNLVEYVRNGGRLFLQAGPLSFVSPNPQISALFPCRKPPQFDFDTVYSWDVGDKRIVGANDLLAALPNLESRATAVGCEPVAGALVLARTRQGQHPVVVSAPFGKGLVVSVLAGDWHSRFGQFATSEESERALRVSEAGASEVFFRWIVEFLQRRQDGGIRPPDLIGPRLFRDDEVLLVRSRGVSRVNAPVQLVMEDGRHLDGALLWLDFLGLEAAKFSSKLSMSEGMDAEWRSLHLEFPGGASGVRRAGVWPVQPPRAAELQQLHNPIVFSGVKDLNSPSRASEDLRQRRTREYTPLLEVFPFLLALLLGLLAIEQYLVHVRWRGRLDR
jgi:hypothetical protein